MAKTSILEIINKGVEMKPQMSVVKKPANAEQCPKSKPAGGLKLEIRISGKG